MGVGMSEGSQNGKCHGVDGYCEELAERPVHKHNRPGGAQLRWRVSPWHLWFADTTSTVDVNDGINARLC